MKRNVKSIVSVLLCFLMAFGQITTGVSVWSNSMDGQNLTSDIIVTTNDEDVIVEESQLSTIMASEQSPGISGTISLPEGNIAPVGGITVKVYVRGSTTKSVDVVIPEGKSLVTYSIANLSIEKYTINYYTNDKNYVYNGYYTENGTTRFNNKAQYVDLNTGNKDKIDLSLILNKKISGTIALPEGDLAPKGGLSINLRAECGSDNNFVQMIIPEGASSCEYSIGVPPNDAGTGYRLKYQLTDERYASIGYYSESQTVVDLNQSNLLDLSKNNLENININIIPNKKVTGLISIKRESNTSDIPLTLYFSNSKNNISKNFVIPKDKDSIEFTVYVPSGSAYVLRYQTISEDFVSTGYYKKNETIRNANSADQLDISKSGLSDINIALISKVTISGIVSLPKDTIADGDIKVTLNAQCGSDRGSANVIIPDKGNSVAYSVKVPPGTSDMGYVLSYQITENKYVAQGFYSIDGTVRYNSKATYIYVNSENKKDINLNIIPKKAIRGIVSIPDGKVSNENVSVLVNATYGSDMASQNIIIEKGNSFGEYLLYVPEGTGYTLNYQTTNIAYIQKGFYNENATVRELTGASKIDTTTGDKADINLTLIPKKIIKGILSLPSGMASENMKIEVVVSTNNTKVESIQVEIPKGENSVPYSLYVPTGSGYNVSYKITHSLYVSQGYYNRNSTSRFLNSATLLEVSNQDISDINITLIQKNKISGILSMPSGVAEKGGIVYKIYALGTNLTENTTVEIPEGQSSVPYEILVPADKNYIIKCELLTKQAIYMNETYYSTGGTVYNRDSASKIDTSLGNQSNVNIMLLEKRKVSGTLSLPAGFINLYEIIYQNITDGRITEIIIPPGVNSVPFTIYYNPGIFTLECTSSEDGIFVTPIYYSRGGGVIDKSKADPIDVRTGNQAGINLEIILKNTISGRVVLSDGVAPIGGYSVKVNTKVASKIVSTDVLIPEKQKEAKYILFVPPANSYKVWYETAYNFVSPMYYNIDGMVRNETSASILDLTKENKSNIDLKLTQMRTVSGSVLLPSGTAPAGGIEAKVEISNNRDTVEVPVKIEEGKSYATYVANVPGGNDYKVKYKINANDYASGGYYGVGGTTLNVTSASILDLTKENKTEINMTLIGKKEISGIVSLPTGVAPLGGINVTIYAGNENSTNVKIAEGQKSAEYILQVPPNAVGSGYKVYYKLSSYNQYITQGYYTSNGMVIEEKSGELIDVSNVNKKANLVIISKSSISGKVYLPSGVAPQGGVNVTLTAQNGSNAGTLSLVIPEGSNYAPYTIYIPSGSGYVLSYNTANVSYMTYGYYNVNGTQKEKNNASSINLGNENKQNIDITLIGKNKITGKLVLSNGMAPTGGISVNIKGTNGIDSGSTTVTIPQGYNSIGYTLYVPAGDKYVVWYETNYIGCISKGYYIDGGTSPNSADAKLVNATINASSIDLKLISKRVIRGTVSLPTGKAPAGGIIVDILASKTNNKDTKSEKVTVTIPEGLKEMPYELYLPEGEEYLISYSTPDKKFVVPGYYSKSGTTVKEGEATKVNTSMDLSGIDITLIPRRIISGTVLIPDGVAPIEGTSVTIIVSNPKEKVETSVIIPKGESSIPYTLYVSSDSEYSVKYTTKVEKYMETGYYSVGGTVRDSQKATLLATTFASQVGINLTLIKKKAITGRISVPVGIAPFGGIKVNITASNSKDKGETTVVIPEVSSSSLYTIYVPEGEEYIVNYSIVNPDGKYLTPAYYNNTNTRRDREEASLLNLSKEDIQGINISLIPNRMISGTIVLPSGVAPTGGLRVNVLALNKRDSSMTSVIINQGSSSATYRLYVPEGIDYKIGYTINQEDYLSGYYNLNQTITEINDATTFKVEKEDISGLDMMMIPRRTISGTLSLPGGALAPAGGIPITLYCGNYSTSVTIPQNKNSVNYVLKVAPNKIGGEYTVEYRITANTDYVPNGFYNTTRTAPGKQTASYIDVSSSSKDGINIAILEKRVITGIVKLQSGSAPEAGIDVTISIEGSAYSTKVTIPYGSNMTYYELRVLPNPYNSGYKLKYTVSPFYGYADTGYYNVKGTVLNVNEGTTLDLYDYNRSDIDLTLLNKNHIEGKVSIQGGVAPVGGMKVSIIAANTKSSGSVDVIIPQGQSYSEYKLAVAPGTGYKLYYTIAPDANYVTNGYHNGTSTVIDPQLAKLFDVNGNVTGKDLGIIPKKTVSGTIKLKEGMVAPAGGFKVELFMENKLFRDTFVVTIPEGLSSQEYSISMPPSWEYRLGYMVSQDTLYVQKGYYAGKNTKVDQVGAVLIDLRNSNFVNANINLIEKREISGTVLIPSMKALEDIDVKITASNGLYSNTKVVTIHKEETGANYTVMVPPGSDYIVSYQVSTGLQFFPEGYYNAKGTKILKNLSEKLDVTNGSKKDIELQLVYYNSISGVVSLPYGNAPKGGVDVIVQAKSSTVSRLVSVKIPEGQSSATYEIHTPDAKGYKLYYFMNPNDLYSDIGYYAQANTVIDEKSASLIDLQGKSLKGVDIKLIGKKAIEGKISLPDGQIAPKDGIEVKLTAIDGGSKNVTIPEGENSAPYSIKVLPNVGGKGYKVKYELLKDYGYLMYGYYCSNGSVRDVNKAHLLDVSVEDIKNADLTIIGTRTIEGSIALPEGLAQNDMSLAIIASNEMDTASTEVNIIKGADRADFKILVPSNDPGMAYTIRYENWSYDNYAPLGYYSQAGTLRNIKEATKVDVRSKNVKDIDMNLIIKRTLSGTISLPEGSTIEEDLLVAVTLKNESDKSVAYVTIPKEGKKGEYKITVPSGKDYTLEYGVTVKNNFVPVGYYSNAGTSYKGSQAQKIDLLTGNKQEMDLQLIVKKSISGIVSLPSGTAPKGGVKVEIYAEDAGDTWVTIPEGKVSVPYKLFVVPNQEDKGYQVRYVVSPLYDFVTYGYYGKDGMVRNSKIAGLVDANDKDAEDIDLTIMETRKITGKVILPDGIAFSQNISLNVTAFNEVDGAFGTIVIPSGEIEAEYTISLPPNDPGYPYKVKYENWSCPVYTNYGYYGKEGTTRNLSLGTAVDVNKKNVGEVDITLLKKSTISGIVSLPDGFEVMKQGMNVTIYVTNGVEVYLTDVNIPYGSDSVPYTVYVDNGTAYKVRYFVNNNDNIMEYGYYNKSGVTTDDKKAYLFNVEGKSIDHMDMVLLKKRKISGIINFPEGHSYNGMQFELSASDGYNAITKSTDINFEGTLMYNIYVPAGNNYVLRYEIFTKEGSSYSWGYYSKDGIERNINDADKLDVLEDGIDQVDFTVMESMQIKGTVQLPYGKAPEGGLKIEVGATDSTGNFTKEVVIPEGEKSASYVLNVPSNIETEGYKISYKIVSEDYATIGYYSESGTIAAPNMATLVDVSSRNADYIDLTLVENKTVRGEVILPDGPATKDLSFNIRASTELFTSDDMTTVIIKKGENKASYSLNVSPNVEGANYRIFYETQEGQGYIAKGFYNLSGTVPDPKLSTPVDVSGGDYNGAIITVIKSKKITGKVLLPEGEKAPKGGLAIEVYALKENYTGYKTVTNVIIPENESFAEYTLYVPEQTSKTAQLKIRASSDGGSEDSIDDCSIESIAFVPLREKSSDYKVGYSYEGDSIYSKGGYFNKNGTHYNKDAAEILDMVNGDISNVDMELLKRSRTIKGTISLPDGKEAPAGGVIVSISAMNEDLDYTIDTTAIIGQGNVSGYFEINVPAIDNYIIKYSLDPKYGYVLAGYYGKNGTVYEKDKSNTIDTHEGNVNNVDLKLTEGKTLSGTIYLPYGYKTQGYDIGVFINATNDNSDISTYAVIKKDTTFVNYNLVIPQGSDYIVSYSIDALFGEYIKSGYHNTNITTADPGSATKINVVNNVSNIKLWLLPSGRSISGKITLPDGSAGVSYSINLPVNMENSGYKLEYKIETEGIKDIFNEKGYIGHYGTVSKDEGLLIDVTGKNNTDTDIILIKDDTVAVEGLLITKTYATIKSGRSMNLDVKFTPQNSTNKNVKWYSSNTNIAVVSSDGVVTAKSPGTASITALSSNHIKSVCVVSVVPSNQSEVEIDKSAIHIMPKEISTLNAIVEKDQEDIELMWSSSNEKVVSVSQDGTIVALEPGTAIVSVANINDPSLSDSCYITVISPVSAVEISEKEIDVKTGYSHSFSVSVSPEKSTDKGVIWYSDNSNIARVSQNGDVTGISVGSTIITARSSYDSSIKGVCKVNVISVPLEKLEIAEETLSIYPYESKALKPVFHPVDVSDRKVRWESSDSKIATVTSNGVVNAISLGEAKIRVTSITDNTKWDEIVVRVVPRPVESIGFTQENIKISDGTTKQLEVFVEPYNATNKKIIWSSSDENIVKVSKDGIITAKSIGQATITASWEENKEVKGSCIITVEPVKLERLNIVSTNSSVIAQTTIQLGVNFSPSNATNKKVKWVSSNNNIATVSSTGVVTGLVPGSVTITAISEENSNIKGTYNIKVEPLNVASISLSCPTNSILAGGIVKITASITPSNAPDKSLNWSSSNSNIATVDGNGVVTGVSGGTVTITATSVTRPSAKASIVVVVSGTAIIDMPVGPIPGGLPGELPTPSPSITPTVTPSPTPEVTKKPDDTGDISEFKDIKGHWAASFFAKLIEKGVISGYPDKTLRPGAQITRAEATVMVLGAAGIKADSSIAPDCKDKNQIPGWAKAFIATAINKSIVKGYDDSTFRPSNKLTRSETVVLVLKAFGIEEAKDKNLSFKDNSKIPDWSKAYVKKAVELGIIKGYNDNTFGADNKITRAEVVTIIAKCMELKEQ